MTQSGPVGRVIFVVATVLLSMLLTFIFCQKIKTGYTASVNFQMAALQGQKRPDLGMEKKLILSDSLLLQVLKDVNLVPQPSHFRSFDLGPKYKTTGAENPALVQQFRDDLEVETYPDNSLISISYQSADADEAKKIVETVYRKFYDWREGAPQQVSSFDQRSVEADKNLAQKREAFLQSQKDLLAYTETNQGGSNQKAALAAQIESLRLRYGPKHPVLVEALKQQQALDAQTADPVKLKALRDKMEKDFIDLDSAMRSAVLQEQQTPKVDHPFEILPLGDVAVTPTPQHLAFKIVVAGAAAFLLSLLYLALRQRWRPVFETGPALRSVFGFSTLATIPGLPRKTCEVLFPAGVTAEALKALRQELKLRGGDAPLKLITVTASLPAEARTELMIGLGRMAARAGEKVMLLDADLRSPGFPSAFPLKASRNLVDYLSGQARLDDVIVRTDPSGVHAIFGTAVPNTALDLLSSEKMKTLLLSLREIYDLVLVLAPVSPQGPDARVLSALSDLTLYVVESGKTLKNDIRAGIAPFTESGLRKVSFILVQN